MRTPRAKFFSSWSRPKPAARLRAWATQLEQIPIGRRFRLEDGLGWMQRWYASQPTQRIVLSVLERSVSVERAQLALAVRGLCARHPSALGICEVRSATALKLRPLTAADELPWFEAAEGGVWRLAEAMLHCPFAPGAPLFRIALCRDGRYVLAAFDHLIADGVSAGIFAGELGALLAGDALLPTATGAALPLDARIDQRPTLGVLARSLRIRAARPVLLAPAELPATHLPALRSQIAIGKLPRDLIDALISEARWHSLTLHAVLCAAALLSALETLDCTRSRLRVTTPISLRDRCRPKPDGLGVFIASVDTDLELKTDDDPWQVARRCRDDIARQRPEAHRTAGLLVLAGDLESLARRYERTANGRTATLEVSNVGRVTGVPSGAAVWLTQGAHYHSALFVLSVATSDSDGALRCCLSYADPLIDRERAERFLRAFERILLTMHHGSNKAVTGLGVRC